MLVADSKRAAIETDLGKYRLAGTGDGERLLPVLPRHTFFLAKVLEPVETHHKVIKQIRANDIIPTYAFIVGEIGIQKVRVQRRGKNRGDVEIFLVAAAVGKEETGLGYPIL